MTYPIHPRYRPLRSVRRSVRLIGGVALAGLITGTAAVAVPPPAAPRPGVPAAGAPAAASSATTPAKPIVHGTRISNAVKTGQTPVTAAMLAAAINPEVALLSHPEPRAQTEARKYLEMDAATIGQSPVAAFQNAYGAALSTALVPLFKSPDARVRLNAAIVLAKVSEKFDQSVALAPAITEALNDSSEGVVLWGLKACKGITPRVIDLPAQARPNQLLNGIIRAVRTFPASTPIAEEASNALIANDAVTGKTSTPARQTSALPFVLTMFEDRIDQYRAVQVLPGVDPVVPPYPTVDSFAVFFLSGSGYGVAAPADKQRITRDLLDLGKELARITPGMPPKAVGGPEITRDDMGNLLGKGVGGGLGVIAGKEAKPTSAAKAAVVQKLNGNSQATAMETAVTELEATLDADKILGGPRATKPATAPAAPATPSPAAGNKPVAATPK